MIDVLATQAGILTTRQLIDSGWTKWQIERAVDGDLKRVRPGWFACEQPDPAALAAVKAGGCVSCFSALRLHGVWVPEGKGEHVRLAPHLRRREHRGRRCHPFGDQPPVTSAVDSLEAALRCVLRCGSREDIVVVIDSILHGKRATRGEIRSWMEQAPASVRSLLDLTDSKAESGSESMVRCRLWSLQIATRIQVRVMQGTRVDLLIGDRLIIECDSKAHHTDAAAYESDRRRDRRLSARGFVVLRLSYRQIHDEWTAIEQDILAIVRRGGHRWPRRRKIEG